MTAPEHRLWRALRGDALGVTFRRQHAIPPWIADFACVDLRLVIEVDGATHAEAADAARDAAMCAAGWQVLRVWNNEVRTNLDGVLQRIAEVVEARKAMRRSSPHPDPPP
jgi:very-short-patch-repair endonuclease